MFFCAKLVASQDIICVENKQVIMPAGFFDNAKIIGLGEPTHGTREVNIYNSEITKLLISKYHVKRIGFELSFITGVLINEAINSGDKNFMKWLDTRWVQQTKEMGALLMWILEYNLSVRQSEKVSIYGFDTYTPDYQLRHYAFNTYKDSTILKQRFTNNELLDYIKNNHSLNNTLNVVSYILSERKVYKRDSLMYALINKLNNNEVNILRAHSGHLTKVNPLYRSPVGLYLKKDLGSAYRNIDYVLNTGCLYATNELNNQEPQCNNIQKHNKRSINYDVSKSYNNDTFISKENLSSITSKSKIFWTGSYFNTKKNWYIRLDYINGFDGFIYLNNSSCAEPFYTRGVDYEFTEVKMNPARELINDSIAVHYNISYVPTNTLKYSSYSKVFVKMYSKNTLIKYYNVDKFRNNTNKIGCEKLYIPRGTTSIVYGALIFGNGSLEINKICIENDTTQIIDIKHNISND